MRRFLSYGGIIAGVVIVVVGAAFCIVGLNGRDQVRSDLARENIVGTPDSEIPGQKVDTGSEAREFANVMREHTLAITKGQTYAEMGRFLDENGEPTNDEKLAATNPRSGEPVENPARQIWVTETALSTALNTAYFAESTATFVIAAGAVLLLIGIGIIVLTIWARPRTREDAVAASPARATAAAR